MHGLGVDIRNIEKRIRFCNYLSVAQIFLQDNFLLNRALSFSDIKPRLLGHWGTCPGINIAYANLKARFPRMQFILGPGHGFPALQANLFYDGDLVEYYPEATLNLHGIEYICKRFSWPYGFPSHASPMTPGVIAEGGELTANGEVIEELKGLQFGATFAGNRSLAIAVNYPTTSLGTYADGTNAEEFQMVLSDLKPNTFIIMKTPKGYTGPKELDGKKLEGNCASHQVPLPLAKTDRAQLQMLQSWLESYNFKELYDEFTTER